MVVTAPVTRRHIDPAFAASVGSCSGSPSSVGHRLVLGSVVGVFDDISIGRMLVATLAVLGLALLLFAVAFTFGAITGRRGPLCPPRALAVGGYLLHRLAASAEAIRPVRVVSPWWWLLDRNLLVQDPSFLAVGLPLLLAAATFAFGVLGSSNVTCDSRDGSELDVSATTSRQVADAHQFGSYAVERQVLETAAEPPHPEGTQGRRS